MKVLIVEDEILIAMHLETLVQTMGHQVVGIATSASEAISLAATYCPDVALMDIRLSDGSSGVEAAREIHARQGLRCIFLSANLDEATQRAVGPCDPIAFVGKPVLPIVLERALHKANGTTGVESGLGQ